MRGRCWNVWLRRAAGVASGVLLAIAVWAAPAADAQISAGPPQTVAGTTTLNGLACTTAEDCYAVGNANSVPAGGGNFPAGAVVAVHDGLAGPATALASPVILSAIACVSTTACLASGTVTGGGALVPITGGLAGATLPAGEIGGLSAITCRTAADCVAVGGTSGINGVGQIVAVSNGSAQPTQHASDARQLNGVACPSPGTCLAVGYNRASQGVVVPIAGATPAAAQVLSSVLFFYAVACPTQSTCVAVGRGYSGHGVVVAVSDGVAGAVQDIPGTQSLSGIACADSTTCVAVGGFPGAGSDPSGSVVVPIAGAVAGTAQVVTGTSYGQLSAIGCADARKCIATGVDPTTGLGDVVPLLLSGPLGAPAAQIAGPSGSTYPLHDPAVPAFAFSCRAAFAGALADPGGCVASAGGSPVANGQAIDTSHAGTFAVTVTATQADGQHATATSSYTVTKAPDAVTFPQLGPFAYRHAAVALTAAASSGLAVRYRVESGPCTVSGSTLTLLGTGACGVVAETVGDADYDAASAASMIAVGPPAPPLCTGLSLTVASTTVATIALGCSDPTADPQQALRYSIATLPAHGALTALDPLSGEVTYAPASDYEGPDSFTFTATDSQGEATPATIAIAVETAPALVSGPAVSGSARPGHALTCSRGTWTGTAPLGYAYRWTRDGSVVAGRDAPPYTVGVADGGRRLACAVTAANAAGSASASSAAVAVAAATFTLGKVTADARGSLSIRIVAGDGGRVRATASFVARTGAKAVAYGSTSARVAKAGAVTLHLAAGTVARRRLRAHAQVRVSVAITFTPPHGRATTKRTQLTVRGPRHAARGRT
jgi:hypothetical protein